MVDIGSEPDFVHSILSLTRQIRLLFWLICYHIFSAYRSTYGLILDILIFLLDRTYFHLFLVCVKVL